MHTANSLKEDLHRLSIREGDTLLLGADLAHLGLISGRPGKTIMEALLSAVGPDGTLLTVSFSPASWRFNVNKSFVFHENSPSNSGALTKLFLGWPGRIRSKHPTNSFVAIGKYASRIIGDHDENSRPYAPVGRAIEANCKMVLLGCVDKRNGMQAIHYAQETLGLTRRLVFPGMHAVKYQKGGSTHLYVSREAGGCSKGFWKFHSHFVTEAQMLTGYFGDAYSAMVEGKRAYAVALDLLRKNPRYALCDDPDCFTCRTGWRFNKRDMPAYYARNAFRLIPKVIRSMRHEH